MIQKQDELKLKHFSTKSSISCQIKTEPHDIPGDREKKKSPTCGSLPIHFLALQGMVLLAHKEVALLLVEDKTLKPLSLSRMKTEL